MPILKNAIKKMHRDAKKTVANQGVQTHLKTVLAKAKRTGSAEDLQRAYSALDKAAKRNLIHRNKAARQKARLAKTVKVETEVATKVAKVKKATKKVASGK